MRPLTLATGRMIYPTALRQHAIYDGLLEGMPTSQMNARILERAREETRDRVAHEPYVITPQETPIDTMRNYPFGDPAKLPEICCVADFRSTGQDGLYFTRLSVIWFQSDFALPLSAEIAAALVALDWDTLADEQEL